MEVHEGVREYIDTVSLEDIPWHRLPTTYGRAEHFPSAFESLFAMRSTKDIDRALESVYPEIVHQESFWPATPFSMVFLCRVFEQAASKATHDEVAVYTIKQFLELFLEIAQACHPQYLEQAEVLPAIGDQLKEEFLWSERYDEKDDELRYEQEGGPFSKQQYTSIYYYTYHVLLCTRPALESLTNNTDLAAALLAQLQ